MEGYPNRDSVPYKELYGLEGCRKLIRGTLRYQGFCVIMSGLKSIGMASTAPISKDIKDYGQYLQRLVAE
jgi:saccharopine dehydrogenase-like NADP-dependent oxidoreductase